jgi:hypothetical protein
MQIMRETPINNQLKLFLVSCFTYHLTSCSNQLSNVSLKCHGKTLSMAKQKDHKFFDKGVVATGEMSETGAMVALAWDTLYAFLVPGAICYGVWKLSGAKNVI